MLLWESLQQLGAESRGKEHPLQERLLLPAGLWSSESPCSGERLQPLAAEQERKGSRQL